MLAAGRSRREIARTLNTAYANGLLSEDTFLHRVDQLLAASVIRRASSETSISGLPGATGSPERPVR